MGLSSGNSVGGAISQPRVEVRSASTLGIDTEKDSNAVGVALSRRRYSRLDSIPLHNSFHSPAVSNVYGYMLYVTFSRSSVPLCRCRFHLHSHRSPLCWHVTYVTWARVV